MGYKSYIGFKTKEIVVDGSPVVIKLAQNILSIDTVVQNMAFKIPTKSLQVFVLLKHAIRIKKISIKYYK